MVANKRLRVAPQLTKAEISEDGIPERKPMDWLLDGLKGSEQ